MKKLMKIAAIGAVIAISLSCVTAFGSESFKKGSKGRFRPASIHAQSEKTKEIKKHEKKVLTEEEKAAKLSEMKEKFAKKLEEGTITKEQYDKIIANLESGKPMMKGRMHGKGFMGKNFEKKELTEEQKAKLEEMKAKFKNGEMPIKRKFEKKELTEEEKAAKLSEMKEKIAKKLEEGTITKEQYDKIIADLESGKPMMQGRMHGKGFMGKNFEKKELTEEQKAKLEEMKAKLKEGNKIN